MNTDFLMDLQEDRFRANTLHNLASDLKDAKKFLSNRELAGFLCDLLEDAENLAEEIKNIENE